ncbi:hypothetical protein PR202_gb20259 [Eleusine coracana subsp. coracana]|uniref:Uncharacterized protein n=1 Tax=Eleusine coracana subsp. coracana TaxID=191504 RepID=A0AAV5F826_ELECO|nr:hypothetical protein PR202_gb20259 [Eleusine coracana subsp. coracana]
MNQPAIEAHSTGLHAGYFPRILRYLLQGLGYHDPPQYVGTRTPLRGGDYAWKVEVMLYEKATDDGIRRVRRVHFATTRRATFDTGISDAAHQALAVLHRESNQTLRTLQFAHFPQRASGSLEFSVLPARGNDTSDRLREQVALTTAINSELTTALDELDRHDRRYLEQEERIQELMEMLAENDDSEEEDPQEAPTPRAMVPPSSPPHTELL